MCKEKKQMAQPIPRYNKDDWQGLKKAMNTQLAELEGEKTEASTEEFWTKFKTSLLEAIQNLIPHKIACRKESKPCFSPALCKLSKR